MNKACLSRRKTKVGLMIMALEPRMMFDGAAVVDAAHASADAAAKALIPVVAAPVEVRAADPSKDMGKKEVAFVDTSVAAYKTLEAGVRDGVAIVEIDGSKDGLAQMAAWAETHTGYDAIHVLSHGAAATLHLGTDTITEASLSSDVVKAELAEIGHALNAGGDLLVYGCNVAEGVDGQKFISDLSVATGADVAASTNSTGASAGGGDWTLEYSSGLINCTALSIDGFSDQLVSYNIVIWNPDLNLAPTSSNGDWRDYTYATVPYFYAIKQFYEGYGVTVSTISSGHLASNSLSGTNMLISIIPVEDYTASDLTYMSSFLGTGGRVLFFGENNAYYTQVNSWISGAISSLGGTISFTNTDFVGGGEGTATTVDSSSPLAAGVSAMYYNDASVLSYSGSVDPVVKGSDGNALVVDQAVGKGRVTVLSDINTWDPIVTSYTGYYGTYQYATENGWANPGYTAANWATYFASYPNNNSTFFYNLLTDAKSNQDTVSSGGNPNSGYGGSPYGTVTASNVSYSPGDTTSHYTLQVEYKVATGSSATIQNGQFDSGDITVNLGSTSYTIQKDTSVGGGTGIVSGAGTGDVVVQYRVDAPDGSWDVADGGTYTVGIVNAAVIDSAGKQIGGDTAAKTFSITVSSGPTVTDAKISITSTPTGTGSTYKTGDTVTARWDDSASGDNQSGITGVTMNFSAFGGGTAVTATDDGSGHWTASYQIVGGSIDGTSKNVSVTATGGSGSTTTADTTNLTVDNQAPTITAAKIAVSGASGTGGAFKVGDTVSASWNATGDGNSDIAASGVSIDFSAFGGGSVAATNSSGTWTATYTILGGGIDGTSKNVSVTALDDAGNSTSFTGTNNKSVDNQAPTVSASRITLTSTPTGSASTYKLGDTVTASWDNSGSGDNNADTISGVTFDFSAFGGGSAVAGTNSSGVWSASYTPIAAGSIDVTTAHVSATATDNAGNTTTTQGTATAKVDNQAPTVTASKISVSGATGTGGAFKVGDTVTATWDNSGSGDNNADTIAGVTMDFSQFGGGSAITATNSSGTWTATYTVVAGSINGTANRNIGVAATDNAGNATTTAGTSNKTVDNLLPVVTSVALDTTTYKIGDTVTATITVNSDSDTYTLTGGSATIAGFTFGNLTKTAATTYTATYTVQSGDTDLISGSPAVSVVLVDGRGNAGTAYTTTVGNAPITINAHAPTDIALSNSSVSTTGGNNAVVGNLASTDATTGETFSYALVAGAGSTDNASFNISSGNLRANDPNALGAGSYSVRVRSTDAAGNTFDKVLSVSAVAGASVTSPTVNEDTDSGAIAITKGNAETFYKITGITGGTLYSDAGYTQQINNGDFIAQGGGGGNGTTTNVYFRPTANRNSTTGGNGSFVLQSSGSNADAGLTGPQITGTVTLTPVADTPSVTSPTIAEDATSQAITITRSANDGTETTHYKITGITGGTLYSDAGLTTQISNNGFVTSGGATTTVYFVPSSNRNSTTGGNGAFTVQAAYDANGGSPADAVPGGGGVTSTITLTPVADTPSVTSPTLAEDTDSGAIAITRNAGDGAETTHYKITGITGGTLYSDAGYTSQINNGDFIFSAGATTNVYFRPTANRNSATGGNASFVVQASESNADAGLGGSTATSTIVLTPVADTPGLTNASTTPSTQTSSGLVLSRAVVDGAEVTYFKITGVTNGNLFKNDGTTPINNGDFITFTEGNAGLKFTPTGGGDGAFTAQASTSNANGGLGGNTVTANIVVNSAPVATGGALTPPGGQVGTAYSYVLPNGAFTDPDAGDTLSYSASGLPAGLTVNTATGAISGNPSSAGSVSITITATDSHGASVNKACTMSIQAAPAPAPAPAPATPAVDPTPAPKSDPPGDPNSKDKGADGLRTVVRDTGTGAGTGLGTGTGFGPTTTLNITIPTATTPTTTDTPVAPSKTDGGSSGSGAAQSSGQASAQPAQAVSTPVTPVTIIPAALTAPSTTAFQVAVAAKAANAPDALVVNSPVKDTSFVLGARVSVTIPADSFASTKADANVTLTATRVDGAALPGWMTFNPQTGTFEGTPPPGFKGEVVVKVIAHDNDGREAVQTFKIAVGEAGQDRVAPGQDEGRGQPQGGNAPGRQGDAGAGAKQASVKPVGKPGLTEQLRAMSMKGQFAKQAALFGAFKTGGKAA